MTLHGAKSESDDSFCRDGFLPNQPGNVSLVPPPYDPIQRHDLEKNIEEDNALKAVQTSSSTPGIRSLSPSTSTKELAATHEDLESVSRVSTDTYGNTYPEGGLDAWLCVLGSLCGLMSALGMMNTIGTYQAYLSRHQLHDQTQSAIGWIFGIYAFLSFFCGIQIGPVFDAKGPRWLIFSGSVLIMATYLLLGVCSKYWHFLVVFGIIGGIGTSLVFTPAIAAIGHFFLRKRGQFTGLAACGGSLGGIVWPLSLQALLPRIGFAWSTRVLGLANLILLIIANLFVKSRLPPVKATKEAIMPDFRIFREPIFALTTLATFFMEWGLFVPLSYLTSYAISHGIETSLSYQLIAILNAGSCFGRYLPGLVADKLGRFNALILAILLSLFAVVALWFPSSHHIALLIIFALVFGFASGSGISLTPVCVGQLCKVENYGRYYATCYTPVSFACLTGIPIAGQLITVCDNEYWGLIAFTGASYAVATVTYVWARVLGVGWGLTKRF